MGQRIGFSEGDVMKLNAMYRCNAAPPPVAPVYAPRGYRSAAPAAPVAAAPVQQYTYPQQQYNYAYTQQHHYGYANNGYYYQG